MKPRIKLKPRKTNIVNLDTRKVDPEVVNECEKLLEFAKIGELVGIVAVRMYHDSETTHTWAGLRHGRIKPVVGELSYAIANLEFLQGAKDPYSPIHQYLYE